VVFFAVVVVVILEVTDDGPPMVSSSSILKSKYEYTGVHILYTALKFEGNKRLGYFFGADPDQI
jgi:hypothetical protein